MANACLVLLLVRPITMDVTLWQKVRPPSCNSGSLQPPALNFEDTRRGQILDA